MRIIKKYGKELLYKELRKSYNFFIKEAYDRANRTLETFINNVEGKNGFYYHFVNMHLI